jgi:hypothetical protein
LVDWPHILLVLTWMVVLLKQTTLSKRIKQYNRIKNEPYDTNKPTN